MKTEVDIKSNKTCGYCQNYLDRIEPRLLTIQQVREIETRLFQGWRLRVDLQSLIHDIKHYLAQQSKLVRS